MGGAGREEWEGLEGKSGRGWEGGVREAWDSEEWLCITRAQQWNHTAIVAALVLV